MDGILAIDNTNQTLIVIFVHTTSIAFRRNRKFKAYLNYQLESAITVQSFISPKCVKYSGFFLFVNNVWQITHVKHQQFIRIVIVILIAIESISIETSFSYYLQCLF